MKRVHILPGLLVTLLLLFVLIPAASAADYALSIEGVTVTDANCADVLGEGTYSYDDESHTLTINKSRTSTWGGRVIESELPELIVDCHSQYTLDYSSGGGQLFYATGNLTFTGAGELTLKTNGPCAELYGPNGVLTLQYATLRLYSSGGIGIRGVDDPSSHCALSLTGSSLYISAIEAVRHFYGGLTLTDTVFAEPAGAVFDVSSGSVINDAALPADSVTFKANIPVTEVKLFYGAIELEPGGFYAVTPTVYPLDASNKAVTWESSDEGVCTVADGVISAVSPGVATVTVTTVDGGFTASLSVIVSEPVTSYEINIDGTTVDSANQNDILGNGVFSYDPATTTLYVHGTYTSPEGTSPMIESGIAGLIIEADADSYLCTKSRVFSLSTTMILTGSGALTAESTENAAVYLYNGADLTVKDMTFTAIGSPAFFGDGSGTLLTIENATVEAVGKSGTTAFECLDTITLTSSEIAQPEGAKVNGGAVEDAEGNAPEKVLILPEGSVIPVTGISLDRNAIELKVGESDTLLALIEPAYASDPEVLWTSSDEAVATVSGGVVNAIKGGTAVITATSKDGGFTAECTVTVEIEKNAESYVERAYALILGREADAEGLAHWTSELSGDTSAGEIIKEFFRSDEYLSRGLTKEQTVQICYQAMLSREASAEEVDNWVKMLEDGYSTTKLVSEFVASDEFKTICADYGLTAGTITLSERDQNGNITRFVLRCYDLALGRPADEAGLNTWCAHLLNKDPEDPEGTPERVAFGFVFADETKGLSRSDAEFITMLYRLMLGREPDEAGLENWLAALIQNTAAEIAYDQAYGTGRSVADAIDQTRQNIYATFADSEEFALMCKNFGF